MLRGVSSNVNSIYWHGSVIAVFKRPLLAQRTDTVAYPDLFMYNDPRWHLPRLFQIVFSPSFNGCLEFSSIDAQINICHSQLTALMLAFSSSTSDSTSESMYRRVANAVESSKFR